MELNYKDTYIDGKDNGIWVVTVTLCWTRFAKDERYFKGDSVPTVSYLRRNNVFARSVANLNDINVYTNHKLISIIATNNIDFGS